MWQFIVTSDDQNSARRFALFELSNNLINMGNNAFSSGYFAVLFVDTFFYLIFATRACYNNRARTAAWRTIWVNWIYGPAIKLFIIHHHRQHHAQLHTPKRFTDSRQGRLLFSCSQKCKHICFGCTMSMGKSPVFFRVYYWSEYNKMLNEKTIWNNP